MGERERAGAPPRASARSAYSQPPPSSLGASAPLPSELSYRFLLVEGDAIAGERSCLTVAGRLLADKADVAVTLYKGVTHGFDVREKSFLSPLEFDAATTEAAIAATLEFLGPP